MNILVPGVWIFGQRWVERGGLVRPDGQAKLYIQEDAHTASTQDVPEAMMKGVWAAM